MTGPVQQFAMAVHEFCKHEDRQPGSVVPQASQSSRVACSRGKKILARRKTRCQAVEPEDLMARRGHGVAQGGTRSPERLQSTEQLNSQEIFGQHGTAMCILSIEFAGIVQSRCLDGSSTNLLNVG